MKPLAIMEKENNNRQRIIIKYNIIGIVINLFLAVFKIIVGLGINSHAVILDAVNGLSDSLSLTLSITSSVLAGMRPSKKHPMGCGRIEYLFSMLITLVIMAVGIQAMVSAIDGILHPHEAPNYNTAALIIIPVSLIFKLAYGVIMRKKGNEVRSAAMTMTGMDSIGDALISVGILLAMALYKITGVDIEHYVCIAISVLIILTGIKLLHQLLDKILGTRIDPDYIAKTRSLLIMEEGVLNINNLVIHNYGENRFVGSADIEVDENMSAADITRLSRRLIRHAAREGLTLTSVGVSGTNITDPEAAEIWDTILDAARKQKGILRVHSFAVDLEEKVISFYAVPDYSRKDRRQLMESFRQELEAMYPDMAIEIMEGIDLS